MRFIAKVRAGQIVLASSCACLSVGSMTGCAMMMEMRPAADSYTYDIGVASESVVRARAFVVLSRFGYYLVRDDAYPELHMESQWQNRTPSDDLEKVRGYEIISRVTVTGAPRYISGALMYHVFLNVENRFVPVKGTPRDQREVSPSTGYAKSIVKQMNLAFGSATQTVTTEQQQPPK